MTIEIHITMTGKSFSPKGKWSTFATERKAFASLTEAQAWLKETYGKCKRVAMYRDKADGTSMQSGYIYGFRNADWSHAPVERWLQQDWCEIRESKTLDLKAV